MNTQTSNNKGNILLVANWESDVGYAWWLMENFWAMIAEHFETLGTSCLLLYPKITSIPESISTTTIKTVELNFSDHNLNSIKQLYRLIKRNNIKHIYLSDSPAYSWFYLLLRLFGIKNIVIHDHTPGERTIPSFPKNFIKSIIHRIPYYTADHFIAVTSFVHDRLLHVNRIPAFKCSIASNGIKPYDLTQTDPYYAHKKFNITTEQQIIVTTGRASYYKGIDFFIKCADELINKQHFEQLHFLFCGDGPDIGDFKALTQELGLNHYFTFAGKRSDINRILPSCTAGLHCAEGEVGYSLSILEYMSAGLVTIVPDNPSVSLAIINLENGLLYKPRDINSACQAVKQALDADISGHLKTNAITTVNEKFNIQNTNRKLIESLQSIFK